MVEANGGMEADRDDGTAIAAVDMGEGSMICSKHPSKNNHTNPGGICAFCLQEKLGKLVSSSLPIAVFPSSTSSTSHSFRSESSHGGVTVSAATRSFGHSLSTNNGHGNAGFVSSSTSQYKDYQQRKPRIPFLSYRKKKDASTASSNGSVIFKRSKSTTTPSGRFLDGEGNGGDANVPQKRGFWSFLYYSKHGSGKRSSANSNGGLSNSSRTTPALTATPSASFSQRARGKDAGALSVRRRIEGDIAEEEDDSPGSHVTTTTTSFGRKVSRSRSVGCGSRSFSGDFFERLSTGLGDCTLRRVESQREGNKSKVAAVRGGDQHSCMKERVRCGGIFGGFMTSSSSSSSSSSQWVSSTAEEAHGRTNPMSGQMMHGRSRSWAWAFASPMRAFSKPPSVKESKPNTNVAPDLAAIPSLLSVSS
uniref:Uncharacterized protein n=1 Tax=Kalanchoe fedtschenkoi TaxID=63787 RepID=A0A7N0UIK0_KALFE